MYTCLYNSFLPFYSKKIIIMNKITVITFFSRWRIEGPMVGLKQDLGLLWNSRWVRIGEMCSYYMFILEDYKAIVSI